LQVKIKSTELYTKCPFVIKSDTLNELAYFSELEIHILNQNNFELSYYQKDKEKNKNTTTYRFGELIKNDLGAFRVQKRATFDFKLFDNPSYDKKSFKVFLNPIENVASYYAANLVVEVAAAGSSILQLTATDVVPEQCADFLNKLTDVYIQNSIEQKNLLATNSLKFIDSQIQQISEELKQIENNMLEFKNSKGIIDIDAESKLFLDQVKNYDEKISENNIQLSFVDYLSKYIKENKKVNDIAPTSIGINDPTLIRLIANLSELENERDRRQYDSKASSPLMETLDLQIKKVKSSIIETLVNIKQNYTISQQEINGQLGKIEGKIKNMPKTEIELIGIKRQFTIKEGLYVYLLQKRSETAILLASTVSDNWIIDKATPSYSPIKPIRSKSNAIAFVIGLLFPALIIFVLGMLNDKISDKDVLENNTKIPLLGIIGFVF
jgi:tyrosine-protein kinase Etk/Wzc